MISARFDDLRPHRRRSFQMSGLVEVIEATTIDVVVDVLDAAEVAVTSGLGGRLRYLRGCARL